MYLRIAVTNTAVAIVRIVNWTRIEQVCPVFLRGDR
jgi:hypothetical protein